MPGNDPLVQDANIRDSVPSPFSYRAIYPVIPTTGRSGAANFPSLTNATNPAIADAGNGHLAVVFAANDNTALYVPWTIPGEYDPDGDEFSILLLVSTPGADTGETLGLAVTRTKSNVTAGQKFVGSSAAVGVAPAVITAPATQVFNAGGITTPQLLTFTFASPALNPYDALTMIVTPGSHTNDAITLHGMAVRVRRHSALRYFPDRGL